jgi:aspartyl-tRNA(Asn)/glutamyl-tRNA(Gln) amidotransferase subunit C
MTIDDQLIGYLEDLSRLSLTDKEKAQAKTDLAGIIGYMAKLGELNTAGLPALSHPFAAVNRFREDKVIQSHEREKILANAPVKTNEYFKAPKTVE